MLCNIYSIGGSVKQADATYNDPLGQITDNRPRTSAAHTRPVEDGFDDIELDDEMLPE